MKSPPTLGPVKKLTDFRWMNLFSVELRSAASVMPWTFASSSSRPELGLRRAGGVGLVIIVKGEVDRLVVVREFRPAAGGFQWSIPFGSFDPYEDIVATSTRELREETGLTLTRIHHISPPVSLAGGLTNNATALVYGEATGEISEAGQEEHEYIETHLLTHEQATCLMYEETPDKFLSIHLYLVLAGFVTSGSFNLPVSRAPSTPSPPPLR